MTSAVDERGPWEPPDAPKVKKPDAHAQLVPISLKVIDAGAIDFEALVEWNGKECDAPDIAFVSIPEVDGRNLEAAGAIFYNLGIARDFKISDPSHRMITC